MGIGIKRSRGAGRYFAWKVQKLGPFPIISEIAQ